MPEPAAAAEPTPRRRTNRNAPAASTAARTLGPVRASEPSTAASLRWMRATRIAELGQVIGETGLRDVPKAPRLCRCGTGSAVIGSQLQSLGEDEVERGMELAALAGQMEAMADLVSAGGMAALAAFLGRMGSRIRRLALSDLSGSSATQALVADIGDVEEDVEAAGAVELAEGSLSSPLVVLSKTRARNWGKAVRRCWPRVRASPPRVRRGVGGAQQLTRDLGSTRAWECRPRASNTKRSGPRSRRRRNE